MARRRRLNETLASQVISALFGIPHPITKQAISIAKHARVSQGGHYSKLGAPVQNYRDKIKSKITPKKTVVMKGTLVKSKGIFKQNNLLPKSMARYRNPRGYGLKPRYGRSYKKRSFRRRRLSAMTPGIPPTKVVKFRLVASSGALGSANGTLNAVALKVNSLNDPTSGISAQLPLYLDQWSAMYSKYIVLGAKVIYKPVRTASTGAGVCGLHLTDSATSLADHDYYKEAGRTKQIILTDQRPSGTIVMKYSGKKFWKLNNIRDDDEQEATFSTTPGDPSDIAYVHLYNQDLSKAEAFSVEGTIIMEFLVLLTNPIVPTRSSL